MFHCAELWRQRYRYNIGMEKKTLPELHLLSSVFLSPTPLGYQRYDTSKLSLDNEPLARIGRYLTGLQTLAGIHWDSVRLFFSLDEAWVQHEQEIKNKITEIFPGSLVSTQRLSNPKEWAEASLGMSSNSVIYLHANDDHALVCAPDSFEREAARLYFDTSARLTMITHYPEVKGVLYRQKPFGWLRDRDYINVEYALGTTLVKTDFFRCWWSSENFSEKETVYRPDNPVGRSVVFGFCED